MIYLKRLNLSSEKAEADVILSEKRTCFGTMYPFKIFPKKKLEYLEFEPVTIFMVETVRGKLLY